MKRAWMGIVAGLAAAVLGIGAAASCVDTSGTETNACPSQSVFTGHWPDGGLAGASVAEYMARRCGTLDCHGSDTRPMRLYGQYGLRHPAESNVSGGHATTLVELKADYGAVCSLEPEKMAQVVQDLGNSVDKLLVVQKARGVEAHKGGAVVKQGDPGDACIAGWLGGDDPATVAAACQTAIDGL